MIYHTLKPLILASLSPRRRDYFQDLGLVFSQQGADLDEQVQPGEEPEAYVKRLAQDKGRSVATRCPDSYVVAADTAVCLGERILGKPADEDEAVAMLLALSGRSHVVRTAFSISSLAAGLELVEAVATEVTFIHLTADLARAYAQTGESIDKAGAYGIQGRGAFLVESLRGSYSNVVGLPLAEIVGKMMELGIIAPCASTGSNSRPGW